jgi:hypothetical protein
MQITESANLNIKTTQTKIILPAIIRFLLQVEPIELLIILVHKILQ